MTPGWLYIASKEFHPDDMFKVGYTTLNPAARIRSLNEEMRGVTGAIGKFRLLHCRGVPRSQTAEARVFEMLAAYRVRQHREFFQAPLTIIVAAVDAVAEDTGLHALAACEEPVFVLIACAACGRVQSVPFTPPETEVELHCAPCGTTWMHAFARDEPA